MTSLFDLNDGLHRGTLVGCGAHPKCRSLIYYTFNLIGSGPVNIPASCLVAVERAPCQYELGTEIALEAGPVRTRRAQHTRSLGVDTIRTRYFRMRMAP